MSKTIVTDNGDTVEVTIYEAAVTVTGEGGGGLNGELLSGSGAPSNLIGKNKDYYHRTDTKQLFGPKVDGVWPSEPVTLDVRIIIDGTEIIRKGTGNVDKSAIEDGDIVEFYDASNNDRKVTGIVLDATDYKAYDASIDKYTNMLTYDNIKPA